MLSADTAECSGQCGDGSRRVRLCVTLEFMARVTAVRQAVDSRAYVSSAGVLKMKKLFRHV